MNAKKAKAARKGIDWREVAYKAARNGKPRVLAALCGRALYKARKSMMKG